MLAGPWEIRDRCPACRYGFVREDGYWVGAMTVLMALVIVGFAIVFVTGMVVTWPDVPWTGLGIVTVVVNGLVSFLLYSWSKTIWVGIDLAFNPPSVSEEAEMATHRAADEHPAAGDGLRD